MVESETDRLFKEAKNRALEAEAIEAEKKAQEDARLQAEAKIKAERAATAAKLAALADAEQSDKLKLDAELKEKEL